MKRILFTVCWLGLLGMAAAQVVKKGAVPKAVAVVTEAPELMPELKISSARLSPETTIELIFPSRMVAAAGVGQVAEVSPLVVVPDLAGRFVWTSTRGGVYEVTAVPVFDQPYTFKLAEGLRDEQGRAYGSQVMKTVSAEGFRVEDQDPKWFNSSSLDRQVPVLFQFNDEVDLEKAAEHFHYRMAAAEEGEGEGGAAAGQRFQRPVRSVAAQLRYPSQRDFEAMTWREEPVLTWREKVLGETPDWAVNPLRRSALIVQPAEPLPVGERWELVAGGMLTHAEGRSRLGDPVVVRLGAVRPFALVKARARTPFDRAYYMDLEFNKWLFKAEDGQSWEQQVQARKELGEALAGWIQITPEVGPLKVEVDRDEVRIHADFQRGVSYEVRVDGRVSSADGLALERPFVAKGLEFVPNPPHVGMPAFVKTQLGLGEGDFEMVVSNVSEVRVRVKRMTAAQWAEAMDLYAPYNRKFERDLEKRRKHQPVPIEDYPGEWVWESVLPVALEMDQSEIKVLNWKTILPQLGGRGALLIEAEGKAVAGLQDERVVTQSLVVSTDLGVYVKGSSGEQLVFVTSLMSGEPVAGAQVTLLDRERRFMGAGQTGADGVLRLAAGQAEFVLVEKEGDAAVMSSMYGDGELWGIYDWEIERTWRDVWKPQRRTFVMADRDLYRPGEVMHLKAMTRLLRIDELALDGVERKARLRIRDSSYRVIRNEEVTFAANGALTVDVPLPAGPLGRYSAEVIFSRQNAEGEDGEDYMANGFYSFLVEDYRPQTFEVTLDKEKASWMDDGLELPLRASYLMGKGLSEAEVSWHASAESVVQVAGEFADYHFGLEPGWARYGEDADEEYGEYVDWYVHGEDMLRDGELMLTLPQPPRVKSGLPVEVYVGVELTDLNQQTIGTSTVLRSGGARVLPGIKSRRGFVRVGEALELDLIAVDGDFQRLRGEVSAEFLIERQRYVTQKVEAAGGGTRLERQVLVDEIQRESVVLKPAEIGTAALRREFTAEESGLYFVTLKVVDGDGQEAISRYPVTVLGGGQSGWRMRDGMRLSLLPESTEVSPGGEAVIAIQSPIEGTLLLTVERNRVHQHLVRPYRFDDPLVRLPIGELDAPNVYVSAVVIRGAVASGKKLALPEYRAGYVELKVPSEARDLKLEIQAEKVELLPGSELGVEVLVRDARGAVLPGADVMLCAVDEGVLALTKYQTPDPRSFFHETLPLAFSNFTSLENLLAEDRGQRLRSNKGFLVGGGGMEEDGSVELRRKFLATPLWLGTALTDERGVVRATVPVPDQLSKFRLMAVASAGAERFGSAESSFRVNKPLMVEPVVPRFARVGDEVLVKALVHNTESLEKTVELSLKLGVGAQFVEEARPFAPVAVVSTEGRVTRQLTIPAGGTLRESFPVRFVGLGQTEWEWSVRELNGDLKDGAVSVFQVEHPVPELREVRSFDLARLGAGGKPTAAAAVAKDPPGVKGNAALERAKAEAAARAQKLTDNPEAADGGGGANLLAAVNPALLEGEGAVKVKFSVSRLPELEEALDYLLSYPYGCAEQTTSATMPWLVLGDFSRFFPRHLDPQERKAAINAGVSRLLQMVVRGDGGLAYWPGGEEPNIWASAYGGMCLLRARAAGASVPDEVVDGLMGFLSRHLRTLDKESNPYHLADAALCAYTLARAGKAEPSYHTLLYERRSSLPEVGRLYLGLAMLVAKEDVGLVKSLLDGKLITAQAGKDFHYWSGDRVNSALRLLALTHMGSVTEAAALADQIWAQRSARGEWGNTFTNAWTLTALAAWERSRGAAGETGGQATLVWGDQKLELQVTEQQPAFERTIALTDPLSTEPMQIQASDPAAALSGYLRLEVRSYPQWRDFQAENHGFGITREYQKVQADGSLLPAENLQVGDLVRISLGIELQGASRFIAIEDALPSVFEAVNPNFETPLAAAGGRFDQYEPWYCDHRELRADKALFFTDHAPDRGKFVLSYLARVIAEGDVVAPPAKVEAMYEPERYGLSETRRFITVPGNAKNLSATE